jgi:hypothetical protein
MLSQLHQLQPVIEPVSLLSPAQLTGPVPAPSDHQSGQTDPPCSVVFHVTPVIVEDVAEKLLIILALSKFYASFAGRILVNV